MNNLQIIIDVKSKGIESAYVYGVPFDIGKEALENQGYRIISLQESAMLRIQEGRDALDRCFDGWMQEGAIYVPNKGAFLTKKSPIMVNAKEATECNRNYNNFYLTSRQVKEALSDSVQVYRRPANKLVEKTNAVGMYKRSIPVNEFGENRIARYAFGEIAKPYGEFLSKAGIKEMLVVFIDKNYTNSQDKAFATQILWNHHQLSSWGVQIDLHCPFVKMRGLKKLI